MINSETWIVLLLVKIAASGKLPHARPMRIWFNGFMGESCLGPPDVMFGFNFDYKNYKETNKLPKTYAIFNNSMPLGECSMHVQPYTPNRECCITTTSGDTVYPSASFDWESAYGNIPVAAMEENTRYCALWNITNTKKYPYDVIYIREGRCFDGIFCDGGTRVNGGGAILSVDFASHDCIVRPENIPEEMVIPQNTYAIYGDEKTTQFNVQFGRLAASDATLKYRWYRFTPRERTAPKFRSNYAKIN